MRTQDEIAKRAQDSSGFLCFSPEVLVPFLDFEHAQPFLKPEVTAAEWTPKALTRDAVLAEMREYMAEYGWPKALDHRGISAGRTVEKMTAWMWLLGDDEAVAFAEDSDNYPQYGAPVLKFICERFGFDVPADEQAHRMARGEHCGADYRCGCGQ